MSERDFKESASDGAFRHQPGRSSGAPTSLGAVFDVTEPRVNLPKGGGAIRSIGEKFAANPVTGTGSASIPIATSPSRGGAVPALALQYDSGSGNGLFGIGWSLASAAITRKTERGIPKYQDDDESDVYLLGGAEDLVPVRNDDGTLWTEIRNGHRIRRYRPRIDGSFARIERWTRLNDGDTHWRVTSSGNVVSFYGETLASRIVDNADSHRVFSWLLCATVDDKGNGTVFEYVAEDSRNVDLNQSNERNRSDVTRSVNRYLKRIKYGNRESLLVQPTLSTAEWLFEVVFDYDEGHWSETVAANDRGAGQVEASIDASLAWQARPDAFSNHRAGFEIRTYRRCRRVLMFHRFTELGAQPCLVASTDFHYNDIDLSSAQSTEAELGHVGSTRFVSQLQAVTHARYQRRDVAPVVRNGVTFQTYDMQCVPPVEFEYSRSVIGQTIEELDRDSVANLPEGFDDATYRWLDLEGEGLPGVLTEQAGAWFYKANRSPISEGAAVVASFAPLKKVATVPQPSALSSTRQWLDLDGDGALDLAELSGPVPGFYERTADENWRTHRAFERLPNINWQDPNLRLIDLTGDGLADVLITEHDVLVWHEGEGEAGFAAAKRVRQSLDEETGPRALFADGTESIFLADMSGDGLTDIVRIRHSQVCYWPNLGYGRFGAKVTLDNSPLFESAEQFNPARIRLADITGSGTVDIIYLKRSSAALYFNQSGNRLSDAYALALPRIDNTANIAVVDLLGNGTACLVWNSPLAANAHAPMRYVRLLQDKPYLLTFMRNNSGGETRVHYAPSTKFYLHDLRMGNPWITKLPFPVHVVERVESFDAISRNRFSSRYAYHHGYFDGAEREFRGFAMVEQWDTDAYEDYVAGVSAVDGDQELAPQFYQPPVLTKTWFHNGAYLNERPMLHQLKREYFGAQSLLPDAIVPSDLDADEHRECLRALKGAVLRREVYSYDGSVNEALPYQVSESRYELRCLQHRRGGQNAVFMRIDREAISAYYERNLSDPRIAHQFNLEIGPYGNVLKSASVVYGRQIADATLPAIVQAEQAKRYITYSETDYTPDIDSAAPRAYRLRVPYESRAYEVTGIAPAGAMFDLDELATAIAATSIIAYEALADNITPQRRLLAHSRGLFLDNSLTPLPLGQWDTLGLGAQSFTLALTDTVVAAHYNGRVSDADLQAAGYVHFDGDTHWWIPSGTTMYPANPAAHFYIPIGSRSPFGIETRATFDRYDLLVERVEVVQAAWNVSTAVNDYRVLGPVLATDANGNRAAVRFDVLGQVIASAVMGKEGDADGDTLDDPTARMEYDTFNYLRNGQPNFVHTFAREQHGAANTRWIESYTYSNGSGGVALVKAQAHPGRALQVDSNGHAVEVDADPRWIGNGRTIVNNKGNPVKKYEPYFSVTHEYDNERALRELGVTPIAFYDAVGRNIRTEFPNGTHTRVEFTPWMQRSFDAGDTVLESEWYADRGSPDPLTEAEPVNNAPRRAAWLSAKHANTPSVVHFDSLGRPFYAIADYGNGVTAASRGQSDLTGRYSSVFDQLGREVSGGFVTMAGAAISTSSAEKGQRWSFFDISGALVKIWDAAGREYRTLIDNLRRPVGTTVIEPGQPERLWQCVVYGDRHPNARALNLLGVPHLLFDQSGQTRVPSLDFKGLPARAERLLARDYQNAIDWSAIAAEANYANVQGLANPMLDTSEVFSASGTYDALGRPTQVTLPDGTVMAPAYAVGGMLTNLRAQLNGRGAFVEFLRAQDYNAKGQRQFARLGNNLITHYFYDPNTFQLTRLLTHADGLSEATALQDLNYRFDAVGNITYVRDDAQQTHYFNNAVVRPESHFEYDAVNQLVRATGRESAGGVNDAVRTHADLASLPNIPSANDATAVRTYTEEYRYDLLGNITQLRHRFIDQAGVGAGWTRHYRYAYQDDSADRTNRLSRTSLPGDADAGPFTGIYQHDAYGNMTRMPHLARLDWNAMDQLRRVDLGGGGTAHYVYDLGGQRIRKVIDRNGSLQLDWIFLGGVMIFRRRRRDTGQLLFERRTVHINDSTGAIAQVDTKTVDVNNDDPVNALNAPLIRYHHGNHLGSCGIETDEDGNVVSYEEYHPFGTTAYRANQSSYDFSLKRFRYSGKERDDESGLYYFGARYYAAWLGRWTSSDPAGFVSGFNLYRYCSNNPVMFHDPNGMDETEVHAPADDPLRDPSMAAEARTFLEGVYSSRLRDQTKVFRIDEMHYVESSRSWFIDAWHLEDRPATEGGDGEGTGSGGDGSEGNGTSTAAATGGDDSHVGEGGDMGATSRAPATINENPPGFTLEVPDQFDDVKLDAMRERIVSDRGVGHRSAPPGGGSRTDDIRARFDNLRNQFNNSLPPGSRASRANGTAIDHTVELQYIIRGNSTAGADTVRPQDHRLQNAGTNSSDGRVGRNVADAQTAGPNGVPEDVPAGGVARSREMRWLRNSENLRTGLRWGGYGLMVAGPMLTAYGASQTDNTVIAGGAYGAAAVEAGGVGYYFYGRFALGGANAFPAGRAAMALGGRVAMGAGGVGQFLLSGYMAYEDAQRGDWVAFGFDALAALGGIALIAAALVTSPAWATGLAIAGIATGLAAGGYWLGRSFGLWGS